MKGHRAPRLDFDMVTLTGSKWANQQQCVDSVKSCRAEQSGQATIFIWRDTAGVFPVEKVSAAASQGI